MIATALVGAVAGIAAGLLGIGGGALMVPALVVFLGRTQVQAEATSLLAIVPTAMVGAWRQDRYGNVARRDALVLGMLSAAGAAAGATLADALPQRVLELAFAALLALIAVRLLRRALTGVGRSSGA